jgi:hypothetical protein
MEYYPTEVSTLHVDSFTLATEVEAKIKNSIHHTAIDTHIYSMDPKVCNSKNRMWNVS